MNPDRLLAHFHRLADAPDAIPRLRRFILDLAVRGKLVPQDPNDEPASELLKRITAEGARLVKKKDATEVELDPKNGGPFELAGSWCWSTIESLAHVEMGQSPPSEHYNQNGAGIPFFQGKADFGERHPTPRYWCTMPAKLAEAGDVLVSVRAPVGPTNVANQQCCIGRGLAALRPHDKLDSEFLLLGLNAFEVDLASLGFGTTFVAITKKQLTAFRFPLPPLSEQHRIVAKVGELMALCDRLEAARNERESRRDRLVVASLHRLGHPAEKNEAFRADARFYFNHLPRLTTRPEHIKQLRQTILNLAVRGRLVPQDPNDEPASELLARFASSKARNRKGRDWTRGLPGSNEEAFQAPLGWVWTRIADTAERVTVGYVGPMKDQYVEVGIPFLRSQNVRANRFREDGLIYISPIFHQRIVKSALAPGDVVIVRSGNVGTACVIPPSIAEANCSDLVVVKKLECVVPNYLCFYLNSLAASHVEAGSVGVALTHFNTKSVAVMPLPLPPLAEQHRIVAKVDELMALCDRLEASLAETEADSRQLLEAVLHEALVPVADRVVEAVA